MSSNNKAVKNALEKLFSMKLTNVISFLSVSERKKKQIRMRVITGLSITGNNEIRLLTFIFINNKTTTTKKSSKHTI